MAALLLKKMRVGAKCLKVEQVFAQRGKMSGKIILFADLCLRDLPVFLEEGVQILKEFKTREELVRF